MRKNNERGQSMVMTVVFMVVLLGFAALVIDVGSWYRAHRSAQATADASALAGAAVLPDTAAASTLADAVRHQERRQRIGPRRRAADHLHAVGLRDGHDHGQGHPPLAGLLREGLRLGVRERDRVRKRDCTRVQRAGHPERHRADHGQLQAPAAELLPRAEPDVQSDVRDADAAQPRGHPPVRRQGRRRRVRADQPQRRAGRERRRRHAGRLAHERLPRPRSRRSATTTPYRARPSTTRRSRPPWTSRSGTSSCSRSTGCSRGRDRTRSTTVIGWVGFVIDSYDASGSTGTINGHFTRYTTDGVPAESGNGGGAPGLGVHKVELTN